MRERDIRLVVSYHANIYITCNIMMIMIMIIIIVLFSVHHSATTIIITVVFFVVVVSQTPSFQFSSVQFSPLTDWIIGGRFSRDSLPVFSARGHRERIWHKHRCFPSSTCSADQQMSSPSSLSRSLLSSSSKYFPPVSRGSASCDGLGWGWRGGGYDVCLVM